MKVPRGMVQAVILLLVTVFLDSLTGAGVYIIALAPLVYVAND